MGYHINSENKNIIVENISNESKANSYYYIMVALSCIISTYGLIMNSVSIIIGAMLIAPLMFPILSVSVSIALADNKLLKKALWAEVSGVMLAIGFSIILTLLLPIFEINTEILARTKPTLMDLVVAFSAGIAGTIAICYRPSSAILPGIAIASALMPPLCVVGIGVAKHDFNIAGGALLLFLSNIIAINAAGIIIFKFVGFGIDLLHPNIDLIKKEKVPFKFMYPFLLLFIISVPLVLFMQQSIINTKMENLFSKSIKDSITLVDPHTELVSINFEKKSDKFFINAEVKSPKSISPEEVRKIENKLEYELNFPVSIDLSVVSVNNVSSTKTSLDTNRTNDNIIHTPAKEISINPDEIIEKRIREKLSLVSDANLSDFTFNYSNSSGIYHLMITLESPTKLDSGIIDTLKKLLENDLSRKISIEIKYKKQQDSGIER